MQPEITEAYLLSQGLSKTFAERFWSRVKKTETCWLWTRKADSAGYGQIGNGFHDGAHIRSHRASWILNRGPIPDGLWVLHNCPGGDNRLCVNPDHLWLGTNLDNNRDAHLKGRHNFGQHAYKFSQSDVDAVKLLRECGFSQTYIAKRFGVTQSHISRILNGKAWNFIPGKSLRA